MRSIYIYDISGLRVNVCIQYREILIHRRLERAISNKKLFINFIILDWNHKSLTKYFHALSTFLFECTATGARIWRPIPSAYLFYSFGATAASGPGPPHSRCFQITHNNALQSVDSSGRVISSSQRPLPDNTRHSQQKNIHAPVGIRTHNLSRRAPADLCHRPRGHWNRPFEIIVQLTYIFERKRFTMRKIERKLWNYKLCKSSQN